MYKNWYACIFLLNTTSFTMEHFIEKTCSEDPPIVVITEQPKDLPHANSFYVIPLDNTLGEKVYIEETPEQELLLTIVPLFKKRNHVPAIFLLGNQ